MKRKWDWVFQISTCLMVAFPVFSFAEGEEAKVDLSSAGWIQYGRIVYTRDTLAGPRLNEGMQSAGVQISTGYAMGSFKIHAGLGVQMAHTLPPDYGSGGYAPMVSTPYVARADLEYEWFRHDDVRWTGQVGFFPYDYAPDCQNLGLYLLRGPVYPGMLTSGFETKYVLPIANTLGFKLSHASGQFHQDLLFTFENEWPTYWDLSPAYIAGYQFGAAFRIGAGIQLNHFLPVDGRITDPKNENVRYIYARTPGGSDSDTVSIAFKGVKVMANFSLDPKSIFGLSENQSPLGAEDLKLYGEIAIIGLDRGKAYHDLYGTISQRMPMMLGFNLPAFGLLDRCAFEIEYYGAPWLDDPTIFEHTRSSRLTPIPKRSALDTNTTSDNVKWSLYASKTVAKHVRVSAQAASDHFRPGIFTGYGEAAPPKNEVPFFSPKEWYWVSKVSFFF